MYSVKNIIMRHCANMASAHKLLLYKRDASPPSGAVIMVAELLGLNMEYKEPALLKFEHKSPEFRKLNPMGQIPVLKDGDFIVSDSHAIIKYLVEKYGGDHRKTLYPEDLKTRTLVDQCMFFDAGFFFIALRNVAIPSILSDKKGPTPEDISYIEESYSVLEAYLEGRSYLAAEHLTIADICAGSTALAMQPIHELDGDRYPKTKAWMSRLEEADFFKTFAERSAPKFKKLMQIFWERNINAES